MSSNYDEVFSFRDCVFEILLEEKLSVKKISPRLLNLIKFCSLVLFAMIFFGRTFCLKEVVIAD